MRSRDQYLRIGSIKCQVYPDCGCNHSMCAGTVVVTTPCMIIIIGLYYAVCAHLKWKDDGSMNHWYIRFTLHKQDFNLHVLAETSWRFNKKREQKITQYTRKVNVSVAAISQIEREFDSYRSAVLLSSWIKNWACAVFARVFQYYLDLHLIRSKTGKKKRGRGCKVTQARVTPPLWQPELETDRVCREEK